MMGTDYETRTLKPEIDEEGFLINGEKWTQEIAEILAREDVPAGLTDDHWAVVAFMREYYHLHDSVPPVRMVCRRTGLSMRRIKQLFPSGLTKGACRIAGIPRSTIRPNFLYP